MTGASGGPASIVLNFFTEQGSIGFGATTFAVRKHGPLSGRWTLESEDQVIAEANKPDALFRTFEVRADHVRFTVRAQSAFTRSYDIALDEREVGVIRPAHPFTRRAFIECAPDVPEIGQLFAFWLVVLTWKRAANNAAASK